MEDDEVVLPIPVGGTAVVTLPVSVVVANTVAVSLPAEVHLASLLLDVGVLSITTLVPVEADVAAIEASIAARQALDVVASLQVIH